MDLPHATMPNGKIEEVDGRWTRTFRPWVNAPSQSDLAAQVADLQQQVASLTSVCLQMQAMIYEMWSGQQSDVIIVPPSAAQAHGEESILRLDS